ncbi:undecaprenyl-diphosphatase [Rhodopseudomonas thermotolerans]|uniref:Undecaprenyl-diphosphatase n=2 Tax=Rhodopseudomonas TaxID=1073 RepID=A0A336JTN0_9BRAD|nr:MULTISPECIES: phosphatase PAP2 family protein [Rhodopseudomonas]RED27621.1 undecaprenyl-diphosphatase [Rhodopseudomonas pentothenatexigens]REF91159.1 undecaprenyl-diphosphatase [Rhodopseudomonas thermotolerans]SSW92892.1 undecaprenyl-diphosphatase [Rhodopseudomonas pentothenatexigens]
MAGRNSVGRPGYMVELPRAIGWSLKRLVREPSHSRRAAAARRAARQALLLAALLSLVAVALMFAVDAVVISAMLPRGTPSLWPIRILTEFGKSRYVLWILAGLAVAVWLLLPRLHGASRAVLIGVGTRVQYLLLAVLVPVLAGEVFKGVIGRGRPFVGGAADPFNFTLFAWNEAYASLPSGHSITAAALAFAVSALWPRLTGVMIVYALTILATRLVLLAHHPSDVVAGALLGIVGAMAVRYWFAARRLAFTIRPDGGIDPLDGPSWDRLKRVARDAVAP